MIWVQGESGAFQSTHPLRGATWPGKRARYAISYFNPRTPCGVRPVLVGVGLLIGRISIHAPLAGCDTFTPTTATRTRLHFNPRTPCGVRHVPDGQPPSLGDFNPRTPCGVRRPPGNRRAERRYFNPRTPCGVRRFDYVPILSHLAFQSTHPLRGATASLRPLRPLRHISIHAPLAGCDGVISFQAAKHAAFQSTHPLRGATALRAGRGLHAGISIHAPLAGCDEGKPPARPKGGISIHAPLAGCDSIGLCTLFAICQFQSTHPLRGATTPRCTTGFASTFQSTHPLRGATLSTFSVFQHSRISIHAPLAGCDLAAEAAGRDPGDFNPRTPCGVRQRRRPRDRRNSSNFNPRTPCGVRQDQYHRKLLDRNFNPRTPCGVRQRSPRHTHGRAPFQSTHPLRGATQDGHGVGLARGISIHAPLAGCDKGGKQISYIDLISIHAPLAGCDTDRSSIGSVFGISIHAPLAGCDLAAEAAGRDPGDFNPRTPCGVRPRQPYESHTCRNFNPRTPCGVRLRRWN